MALSETIRQLDSQAKGYVLARPLLRRSLLVAFWSCVVSLLLFAALVLTTRWVLLPHVGNYVDQIEQQVSNTLKTQVRIGGIEPSWEGFWPRLVLKQVRVSCSDNTKEAALTLPQVEASFYWKSVLGTPAFRSLRLLQPKLNVERISETVFEVGGLRLDLAKDTPSSTKKATDATWLDFLARQGRLDLVNANIHYSDRRAKGHKPIRIENLNASFARSIRHWNFGLQADYLGEPIDVRIRLVRPLLTPSSDWRTWAGEAYAKIESFDCVPLLRYLISPSPLDRGKGSGEIWVEFDKGDLKTLSTDILLEDIEGRFGEQRAPLRARQLQARLTSTLQKNTLEANVERLAWVLPNGQVVGPFMGTSRLVLDKELSSIRQGDVTLAEIDIGPMVKVASRMPYISASVKKTLRELAPTGQLSNIHASWRTSEAHLKDWHVEADFQQLSIRSIAKKKAVGQPGFENLNGSVSLSPTEGSARLRGLTRVSLPGVFEFPNITLKKFAANLDWKTPSGGPIQFGFEDVTIANDDLALSVYGQWTSAKSGPGTLQLQGKIDQLKASAAWRYMPLVVSADTRLWLEGALRGGEARDAKVIVKGALQDFPWADAKNDSSHFLIAGTIKDGLLDFAPEERRPKDGRWKVGKSWPIVSGINGTIRFEGNLMDIQAKSAQTNGATSSFVSAVIPDLSADVTQLEIQAKASGKLADMCGYLEKSPVGAMLGNAFSGAKTTGKAKLDLALHIPLEKTENTRVEGTLFFDDNGLDMHHPIPPLSAINGQLRFTESGASAKGIQAATLGTLVGVDVSTLSQGAIRIDVAGTIDPKRLAYFNDTPFLRTVLAPLDGKTEAQATITIDSKKGTSVTARTDLKGVVSNYPAPYAKHAEEAWPTTFSFKPLQLRKKHGYLLKLASSNRLDLILQIPGEAPAITPIGALGLGKQAGLPRSGFLLDIKTDAVNAQVWEQPVRDIVQSLSQHQGSINESMPELEQINYEFGDFLFGDTQLHRLHGRSHFVRPGAMEFTLAGDEINGTMLCDFFQGEHGHISAHLDRYHAVKSLDKHFKAVAKINPKKTAMPSLDLTIDDLAYAGAKLGVLTLKSSTPKSEQGTDWKIETLTVVNPDASLTADGLWSAAGTTSINAKLDLVDVGAFLRRINHPGIVAQGSGLINASLTWHGSPWDPLIETLQGTSSINIRRGIIEQADLGVGGAFLSLVSFQSMLRRLTLDFFDFAHTNYTFDAFTGDIRVENGIAKSDNIKCVGAKASIMLSGSANFVNSTVDAKALVVPDINAGGAAISLAFINPVVGLGAFVGQWLLSHPLSQMMSMEYAITGPLGNPTLRRIGETKENPEAAAQAP